MYKSPIEIAIGQTQIFIEDEVCKAVGNVGIHINKEELLTALKAYEFVEELINYIAEYPDDDYMTMECLCRKLVKHGLIDKEDGYYLVSKGIKVAEQTEPSCQKCKWWNSEELKCSISSVSDCDYEQTEPITNCDIDCSWK